MFCRMWERLRWEGCHYVMPPWYTVTTISEYMCIGRDAAIEKLTHDVLDCHNQETNLYLFCGDESRVGVLIKTCVLCYMVADDAAFLAYNNTFSNISPSWAPYNVLLRTYLLWTTSAICWMRLSNEYMQQKTNKWEIHANPQHIISIHKLKFMHIVYTDCCSRCRFMANFNVGTLFNFKRSLLKLICCLELADLWLDRQTQSFLISESSRYFSDLRGAKLAHKNIRKMFDACCHGISRAVLFSVWSGEGKKKNSMPKQCSD